MTISKAPHIGIYVFNRLFGTMGVNEGLSRIFAGLSGVYWGYSGTILELLWLHQASWALPVLYCGYQCYLEAIWGLSVLFGGHYCYLGMMETFGGPNRAIWGLFWDVVVAWGNLEAFRAFLGYLGAIGAIWGLPGILWYLWAHYFYLGDILGLFWLTRAS